MKKNISIIILLSCNLSLHAQNPVIKLWDYAYGGYSQDYLTCLQQTGDGGFILGGFSSSPAGADKTQGSWGHFDFWIVKLNAAGEKEWDKDYGGTGDDRLYAMQQTKDRGYILGGISNSGSDGDKTEPDWDSVNFTYDFWIVKTDSLGNKEWDKDLGGTENENLNSIQQTKDGGYILGGSSVSGIGGDKTQSIWDSGGYTYDYWIVKIDSLGNKQWDKDLGGTGDDQISAAYQTSNGDYFLAGSSQSAASGDKSQDTKGEIDYWFIKTDSSGNMIWDKDYGGSLSDIPYDMKITGDGGAIIAGVSNSGISGDKTQANWDNSNTTNDYWLVKIDSIGNKEWDKVLGGTDAEPRVGNVSQTSDGGYLVAGISYSEISGNKTEDNLGIEQTWVVKLDSSSNVEWDKTIFTTAEDETGYSIRCNDGCYLMANYSHAGIGGYKTETGEGFEDYWIVKFCDSTSIPTNADLAQRVENNLYVYPNPFKDFITLVLDNKKGEPISLRIINVLGQTVFTLDENYATANFRKILNLNNLESGIYYVAISINGQPLSEKILKQ